MTVIFGNLTNVFGGFSSPGSTTVTNVSGVSDFKSLVTKFAVQFVLLGVGVLVSSFLGMFFWTLSGERISRRIRGYHHSRVELTLDCICKLFFVKTLRSLIDLALEK
jgi:threonine/homoserine/homoserine lactone efflux protein